MAAPSTISACGYFSVNARQSACGRGACCACGPPRGNIHLRWTEWTLTGSKTKKTFRGKRTGSVLDLEDQEPEPPDRQRWMATISSWRATCCDPIPPSRWRSLMLVRAAR